MEEYKRYMLLALLLNLSITILSLGSGHTIYDFSRYAPSDGPLYYTVALNPLSFDKNVGGIRYVRILSPLVTYIFARGNEVHTALSIEFLNILFFVTSIYPAYRILKKWEKEDLTILYIFNPFLLWSVHTGLVEPLFLLCTFSSVLFYLEGRSFYSTLFLILSVLTKPIGIFLALYYLLHTKEKRGSIITFFVLVVNVLRVQLLGSWASTSIQSPVQFVTNPSALGIPIVSQALWILRKPIEIGSLLVFMYVVVVGLLMLKKNDEIAIINFYLLIPSFCTGLDYYIDTARTSSMNLGVYLPFDNRHLKKAKYLYCVLSLTWIFKTMNICGL